MRTGTKHIINSALNSLQNDDEQMPDGVKKQTFKGPKAREHGMMALAMKGLKKAKVE